MTFKWFPNYRRHHNGFLTSIMFQFLINCSFNSEERNVIEAAAKGASTAISLVANIAANLIAFLAFLSCFNALLSWFFSMVGHPEVSFEVMHVKYVKFFSCYIQFFSCCCHLKCISAVSMYISSNAFCL